MRIVAQHASVAVPRSRPHLCGGVVTELLVRRSGPGGIRTHILPLQRRSNPVLHHVQLVCPACSCRKAMPSFETKTTIRRSDPCIELLAIRVDARMSFVSEPQHGQCLLALPPLHATDGTIQIHCDLLPGIQPHGAIRPIVWRDSDYPGFHCTSHSVQCAPLVPFPWFAPCDRAGSPPAPARTADWSAIRAGQHLTGRKIELSCGACGPTSCNRRSNSSLRHPGISWHRHSGCALSSPAGTIGPRELV